MKFLEIVVSTSIMDTTKVDGDVDVGDGGDDDCNFGGM